jgi:hypothetical protein
MDGRKEQTSKFRAFVSQNKAESKLKLIVKAKEMKAVKIMQLIYHQSQIF